MHGKCDSGMKLTSPEFSFPFAQAVNRMVQKAPGVTIKLGIMTST